MQTIDSNVLKFSLLCETSNIQEFDSENEDLNRFLKNLALLYQQRHFGITVVCSYMNKAMGYYTLSPASVQREILPDRMLTGPKPNPIPGFRICRLAVDKQFQGQGFGKKLLVHAIKKCVDQSKQIGGSLIIIDAKDIKARQFYEYFGFLSLPTNPLVLVQTIKFISSHYN